MKNTKSGINTKVAIPAGKGMGLKSQPPVGKLPGSDGSKSMPGSSGKGQMIKTIPSNLPTGAPKRDTAMGTSIIDGFV